MAPLGAALAQDAAARPGAVQVQASYPGVIELEVDASDSERRIQRVRQRIPVAPGALTLWYPQWIPGNHAPTGPINQMAGLVIRGNGRALPWTRDSGDMYAFQLQVPEGVGELEVEFQYLSPTAADQGRVAMTPNLLDLQWHRVVLYPAGVDARGIQVKASLRLPAGWHSGTALDVAQRSGSTEHYAPVSLMTLIDSPVFAGRYFKRFALDDKARQPVWLDVVAENPQALQADAKVLAAHRALVAEADALFGARPYPHYTFLLAVSDVFSGIGLEHAQSSENGMHDGYLRGERPFVDNDLLPHEYAHAWVGKAWRPRPTWVPHYNAPMHNDELWMYEGQTQYWAVVLAARSGLWQPDYAMAMLAQLQATYATQPGRQWRDLHDTVHQGILDFNAKPQAWADWQRAFEFYNESTLLWLGVDARLRSLSRGKVSLDTFARRFHQGGTQGEIRLYDRGDVMQALEALQPGGWDAFIGTRLDARDGSAPEGLAAAGWELYFSDAPNPVIADGEADGVTDLQYSLGLKTGNDGGVQWVGWDSPAFKAGLAKDVTLVAVNGLAYSGARLKQAVTDAKAGTPLELIVRQADSFRSVRIDYRDGLRYPHLRRIDGAPDLLTKILAPRR
ncbi:peptidase M61 [Stenotrophomonas sp. YIM B06876]|uniref:M61 family metallopeptidase n=1 Tax=Stenotrophomonas sp. YIM B06876 TaxID=3060211 RepID=UPI002738C342|nr:peptidase M61 [Stenotrophomonas sp. YIM B06876]